MDAMLQWLGDNWGNLASVGGLAGVGLAIWQLARTRKAAEAARQASKSTEMAISTFLVASDLQHAIDLIQQVKGLHRAGQWESAIVQYQPIRFALAQITSRDTRLSQEQMQTLRESIGTITSIEDSVDSAVRNKSVPDDVERINSILNSIQSNLESMVSKLHFPEL